MITTSPQATKKPYKSLDTTPRGFPSKTPENDLRVSAKIDKLIQFIAREKTHRKEQSQVFIHQGETHTTITKENNPNTLSPQANAIYGAKYAPVTKKQIKMLILEALQAHRRLSSAGFTDYDFNTWRHDWIQKNFMLESFRAVTQNNFLLVLNQLRKYTGRPPLKPDKSLVTPPCGFHNETPDDVRRASAKIDQLLDEHSALFGSRSQADAYAEAITLRVYRLDRAHCSAKQLWTTFFTLKNRINAKLKKGIDCNV